MWHTLGIEPTTDIKKIKTAYARLAKQFNPEEHPEEFQKIFDAYKAACAYAKRNKEIFTADKAPVTEQDSMDFSAVDTSHRSTQDTAKDNGETLDFSGVDTSRRSTQDTAKDSSEALDFSGVDTSRRSTRDTAKDNGETLDFSGVDTSRRSTKDTAKDSSEALDFSGVDTSRKASDSPPAEDELDFSAVGESKHSDTAEADVNDQAFDFSGVNDKYDESDEKRRIVNLRITFTNRLRNLTPGGSYDEWKKFFEDPSFNEIVNDYTFRINAAKILNGRPFKKEIAQLIAGKFERSTVTALNFTAGLYQVFIIAGNNPAPKRTSKRKPTFREILLTIVIVAMSIPLIFILIAPKPAYSSDSPPQIESGEQNFVTLRPYVEGEDPNEYLADAVFEISANTSYSAEELYKLCTGKWEFSFGYVKLFEADFFEISYNGQVYRGECIYSSPEKDALLKLTFRAPDTEVDGFRGSARLFQKDGMAMLIVDNEGKIFTGSYVSDSTDSDD